MVEVKGRVSNDIPIKDMGYGKLGVITKWDNNDKRVGEVVQKFQELILVVGKDRAYNIPFFEAVDGSKFMVRILPNGTELIIKDNE